jgi:Ca-activated chloride channel family protein
MRTRALVPLSLALLAGSFCTGTARTEEKSACTEDAMLVFDASRSMDAADSDNAGLRRIDSVRTALARVLPRVGPRRRLGLVTYGPGPENACANIRFELAPAFNAADRILARVNGLKPDGRTPLTAAVALAAEVLQYKERPATIVLVTDGEETCRGAPCELARSLKRQGARVTVHVLSYKIADSLGSDGVFASRCLADETGGLYVAAETTEELVEALEKTLACPLVSDRRHAPAGDRLTSRSAATVR